MLAFMDFSPDFFVRLLIRLPVILLALTIHEWAHAYSAWKLGDPTARSLGRVSFNPLVHLDPIGTLCLMFAPIGWAKPVPVNPLNFRNPGRDDIIVSVAGPLSNLAQAIVFALLMNLPWGDWADAAGPPGKTFYSAHGLQQVILIAEQMVWLGLFINVALAVFNMLPFFPLDGHHVARENLRGQARENFIRMQPYGPMFIIAIILLENSGRVPILSWPILKLVKLLLTLLVFT